MKLQTTFPPEVLSCIESLPYNKTVKKNAEKIWAALQYKNQRCNQFGYFEVPSVFLKSINLRYYNIINYFIKNHIIEFLQTEEIDKSDIFSTTKHKSYCVKKHICMKYKLLIENKGIIKDIELHFKDNRWFNIIQNSLKELNYSTIKITRDQYGRRVHHSAIRNYKKELKGYYSIDGISSQPRLLYNMLKKDNIIDKNFNFPFENKIDFYEFIVMKFDLKDNKKRTARNQAKILFLCWINGRNLSFLKPIKAFFYKVNTYINKYKKNDYRAFGSYIQRYESNIWIDNLLENIPTEFALPIHDCLIVKKEDRLKVLEYCKTKYPEMDYKISEI